MKGYKVFNPDWKCRGFQYKVGETFKHNGEIEVCEEGFHFCQEIADCFNYYDFDINNRVAEIEATGKVKTDGDKSVTDEIKIIREISWYEVLHLVNKGKNCMGFHNYGNYNYGDRNSGGYNYGRGNYGYINYGGHNTGNENYGNCNSGDRNYGSYNSSYGNYGGCNSSYGNYGNYNSGFKNYGKYNSGHNNYGSWNSCNFSYGFFNSVSSPVYAFNKPLNISIDEFAKCEGLRALGKNYINNTWIFADEMTDEEKKNHPEYEEVGGYLKTVDFKTACQLMWAELNAYERQAVCEMPNFDSEVFMEITGIDVTK